MLSHINIGTGIDITIKELKETIREVVDGTGNISLIPQNQTEPLENFLMLPVYLN